MALRGIGRAGGGQRGMLAVSAIARRRERAGRARCTLPFIFFARIAVHEIQSDVVVIGVAFDTTQ